MKIIGLTGGIASGKSTAARLLSGLGVPVIDADRLSRAAVEPGTPGLEAIARRWPEVIRADGTLDRPRLGAIVFADAAERRALSSLLMPSMIEAFRRQAAKLQQRGEPFAVFEAATLFEEGLDSLVDGVLVIAASEAQQIERLRARNGYTEAEARARLAAQLPLEEKVRRSRWMLDNGGGEGELAHKVRALWPQICREA
jgi:dephospho-CoA kinase